MHVMHGSYDLAKDKPASLDRCAAAITNDVCRGIAVRRQSPAPHVRCLSRRVALPSPPGTGTQLSRDARSRPRLQWRRRRQQQRRPCRGCGATSSGFIRPGHRRPAPRTGLGRPNPGRSHRCHRRNGPSQGLEGGPAEVIVPRDVHHQPRGALRAL